MDQDHRHDEEVEQLQYMHEVYMREYENIINTLSTYNSVASQVGVSREAIGNLEKLKNNSVLFNIGSGMYLPASISKDGKVMVYIGAGYFTEKSAEDAKEFLDTYSKRNTEIIKQLNSEKRRFEEEIFDIEYKLGLLQQ